MGYRISYPEIDQAKTEIGRFDYALLYMFSEQKLCEVSELESVDWEECMEARFFKEDSELHLIFGDEPIAILVEEKEDSSYFDRTYALAPAYRNVGKRAIVRCYTKPDEDGQQCVCLTRLVGIEKEA